MPVQFTKGKYKGASVVFSVFWNRSQASNPVPQSTDDFSWSSLGWGSLYTGILKDDVTSSYSISESMLPAVPNVLKKNDARLKHWKNPFAIELKTFVDTQKYPVAFPWVRELTITIRAYSKLRYALASYANQQPGQLWYTPQDTADTDIVLSLKTFSPITENQLFSNTIFAPYYEGAATVTMPGKHNQAEVVGYSWVEHMAP